ncbi:hypothetical protein [Hafnia alvei]|uniref:hypothetical protein n=1 Tax=Hafnia alvei TaxID=569 RepID=UPI00345D13CE
MENIYFSETAGSYNKFYFRLFIKKLHTTQLDTEKTLDCFSDEETAVLFHEYIHHLQNISCASGLWHCDSLISIWHNTRNFVDKNSDLESRDRALYAHGNLKFFFKTKNQYSGKKNITFKQLPEITLSASNDNESDVARLEKLLKPVIFEGYIDGNKYNLQFGLSDFLESAAYELEKAYRLKIGMKNPDDGIASIPYKFGQSLKNHYAEFLDETQFIKLILVCTQHIAPHAAFLYILQNIKNKSNIDNILNNNFISLISQQEEWVDRIVAQIQTGFPYDDPIHGNFIKSLFKTIKKNIQNRKIKNYPELDFIESINKRNHKEKLRELIESSGGCIVCVNNEFEGDSNFIIGEDNATFKNSQGWQILQASTHYTMLHYNGDTITNEPTFNSECPMYSFCLLKDKINDHINCTKSPWLLPEATGNGSDCPYQLAVFKSQLKNA